MRVIAANNYYYLRGGCERVFFGDMRALASKGIEVIPFSAVDAKNLETPYSAYFAQGADVQASRPIEKLKAAVDAVYCKRTVTSFARLMKDTSPDIVHCHNIYGRLSTSLLSAAGRSGIPVVLTVHDYKLACPSYLMLRNGKTCQACIDGSYYRCALYRCHKQSLPTSAVYAMEAYFTRFARQYDNVAAFLCPSRFMLQVLQRAGLPANRLFHHPNAIDVNACEPNWGPGEYALYVGRLSHEKGIATLLQAILPAQIPLRIAGDGPMAPMLREMVARNPTAYIVFEGACGDARLQKLYRNAAFVVVPSEWYENAPMTVMEAFAYGKPVIGSEIGGIPEFVRDGETGYLFPAGDRARLEMLLQRLWADRTAQRLMGQNARRLVETQYSQESRVHSLMEHYKRVCSAA